VQQKEYFIGRPFSELINIFKKDLPVCFISPETSSPFTNYSAGSYVIGANISWNRLQYPKLRNKSREPNFTSRRVNTQQSHRYVVFYKIDEYNANIKDDLYRVQYITDGIKQGKEHNKRNADFKIRVKDYLIDDIIP
jgi:hypothetical protein